jgi:hypothetical protein
MSLEGKPGDADGAAPPGGMPYAMEMPLRKERNVAHLCDKETEVMVTQIKLSHPSRRKRSRRVGGPRGCEMEASSAGRFSPAIECAGRH